MIGAVPFASTPIADLRAPAPAKPPAYRLGSVSSGALFVTAEIEVYRPGGAIASIGYAFGEAPIAALPPAAQQAEDYDILRASDLGYVSPSTDPAGSLVYPATLDEGFSINRLLDLSPGGGGASVTWGAVRLLNADRRYDMTAATRNVDQRSIRLRMGSKLRDAARGILLDPPAADLADLFAGLSQGWAADATGVSINVRDASAWLDRPLQSSSYAGTGLAEGTSDLTGRSKPRARGGTLTSPMHVEPVLVDPVANIWQWTDAPGNIIQVYEDGAAVFLFGGNVANLWAGSTPAGYFRTCLAAGLFQLGSPRAGRITADVQGGFALRGIVTTAAAIALGIMVEDLALPADLIDQSSFIGLDAAYPYAAGWYWQGAEGESGTVAVARLLASIGARLVVSRSGRLRAVALRPPAAGVIPAASYTTQDIVSVARSALPADCSPPPYRLRWNYAHNFAVLSTFKATVTDARRIILGGADLLAGWSSATVIATYRRPSDPLPVVSALRDATQAATVAAAMGGLWGVARRLYAVELPLRLGVRHEIGETIVVAYPIDDLDGGRLGTVVGEFLRAGDMTTTLQVIF